MILLCVLKVIAQKTEKNIVGYYPDWQVYDRAKLAAPKNLDYKRLSTIVYSFFIPSYDGTLSTKDEYITELILKGQRDWRLEGKPAYYPMTSLVELAHSKKTNVMISIGGWTGSEHFSAISADSNKRSVFIKSCIQLIERYDIDGIDIDWEFPGRGSSQDSINFTYLINDLREALDFKAMNAKKKDKKQYFLSIAISSSDSHMKYIQWEKVISALDFINVMTYDYAGSWLPKNNHKSPLYTAHEGEESIDNTVNILLEKYKVPASMLNIGSSFSCNAMSCHEGENKLGDVHKGKYDDTNYPKSKGQPTYYEVQQKESFYELKWDSTAKSSYMLAADDKSFVSCESERAIVEKVAYVKEKGLKGIVIWDITGDMMETKLGSGIVKNNPLLKIIHQELKK